VKILEVLASLDADVWALVEVENDGAGEGSAVRGLADALTLRTGVAWDVVDPGADALGSHAIAVALLYRPDRVEPVGRVAVLGAGAHPDFDAARNRPSLARSFVHLASGERLTVVANHLKSKGSACAGDPDTADGQGECSETRRRAASGLAAWLAGDPTGAPDAPPLILGDLNAYPSEDALGELADAGFVDLLAWFVGPDAYSYVFDAAAGRLDHALASPGLLPDVAGAAVWHVNADAPPVLGYADENPPELFTPEPIRASDHDPVLIGLFREQAPRCAGTPPSRCRGAASVEP
jgi:predicted extracellular nuclease